MEPQTLLHHGSFSRSPLLLSLDSLFRYFFCRVESSDAIFIVNSSRTFYRLYVEYAVQRSLTLWLVVSAVFPSNQRVYLEGLVWI